MVSLSAGVICAPGDVNPGHMMLAPLSTNLIAPLSTCWGVRINGSERNQQKWLVIAVIVYKTFGNWINRLLKMLIIHSKITTYNTCVVSCKLQAVNSWNTHVSTHVHMGCCQKASVDFLYLHAHPIVLTFPIQSSTNTHCKYIDIPNKRRKLPYEKDLKLRWNVQTFFKYLESEFPHFQRLYNVHQKANITKH